MPAGAHGAAQPQKPVLTRAQADDLHLCRLYGCVPTNCMKHKQGKFNGSPIEVSDATPGVLVAQDDAEMPLADFDQLAPA